MRYFVMKTLVFLYIFKRMIKHFEEIASVKNRTISGRLVSTNLEKVLDIVQFFVEDLNLFIRKTT